MVWGYAGPAPEAARTAPVAGRFDLPLQVVYPCSQWAVVLFGVVDDRLIISDAELEQAIDSFDRAFIEGRLDDFLTFFAEDARLLLHNQEPVGSKEAITAAFRPVFDGFDASAYDPRYEIVDAHDDRG